MRDYAEQARRRPEDPNPEVTEELRRRAKDCPAGTPLYKWAVMNRAERRARTRKGGKL